MPSERAGELISGALAALGLARGFVVNGSDGLDEITTTGPTLVFEIRDGKVERRTLEPDDFAVQRATPADLNGGDKARNLEIAMAVLGGAHGPQRDIVLANAAAALVAAGRVETFLEGMAIGTVSIDSGAARRKVAQLAEFTAGHWPQLGNKAATVSTYRVEFVPKRAECFGISRFAPMLTGTRLHSEIASNFINAAPAWFRLRRVRGRVFRLCALCFLCVLPRGRRGGGSLLRRPFLSLFSASGYPSWGHLCGEDPAL